MKIRLLTLAISCAVAMAAAPVSAQAVPVPGTGCPGDPAPTIPGGRPPSTSAPFQIACSPSPLPCSLPQVMIIGMCTAPIPIPPPIGCGPCSLAITPSFGTFPDPVTLFPPSLPVGFTFCVQCGCIATPALGPPCVRLSEALMVTMTP